MEKAIENVEFAVNELKKVFHELEKSGGIYCEIDSISPISDRAIAKVTFYFHKNPQTFQEKE